MSLASIARWSERSRPPVESLEAGGTSRCHGSPDMTPLSAVAGMGQPSPGGSGLRCLRHLDARRCRTSRSPTRRTGPGNTTTRTRPPAARWHEVPSQRHRILAPRAMPHRMGHGRHPAAPRDARRRSHDPVPVVDVEDERLPAPDDMLVEYTLSGLCCRPTRTRASSRGASSSRSRGSNGRGDRATGGEAIVRRRRPFWWRSPHRTCWSVVSPSSAVVQCVSDRPRPQPSATQSSRAWRPAPSCCLTRVEPRSTGVGPSIHVA